MKINTRKVNKEFGTDETKLMKRLLEDKLSLVKAEWIGDVQSLKAAGLVDVESPGPGWGLYVYLNTKNAVAAGYIFID